MNISPALLNCTDQIIGNGNKVQFWNDIWCGLVFHKDKFPQIYAISSFKNGLMKDAVSPSSLHNWNVTVTRNLHDWKIEECENLLHTLSHIHLKHHDYRLRWKYKSNGCFTVSSFYDFLDDRINCNQRKFPAKIIWKSGAPPKISFFAWEATKEKI